MRRNTYRIYAVLILGLMFLFSIPNQIQQTLRNQFLRPLLPFGHILPLRKSKFFTNYPSRKVKIEPPKETSYPGASLAKIIYRNPSTWSDFFWINLGSSSNKEQDKIVLNSPVIFNGALIGLVDFVGEKQSRVQLITNSNLTLSVRALRGQDQYEQTLRSIDELLSLDIVSKKANLCHELQKLKSSIEHESLNWYLAKGELYGTSAPLWRSKSQILLGRGFNCEFADEYGPSRNLITGRSLDKYETKMPILEPDDLLITTGLDGIFPEGLEVARVTEIDSLIEGAFSYTLKANPIAGDLQDLDFVEVILPIGYKNEQVKLRAFAQ